jgi:hypothetical protein
MDYLVHIHCPRSYAGKVLGASTGEVKQVGQITKARPLLVVFLATSVHKGVFLGLIEPGAPSKNYHYIRICPIQDSCNGNDPTNP